MHSFTYRFNKYSSRFRLPEERMRVTLSDGVNRFQNAWLDPARNTDFDFGGATTGCLVKLLDYTLSHELNGRFVFFLNCWNILLFIIKQILLIFL